MKLDSLDSCTVYFERPQGTGNFVKIETDWTELERKINSEIDKITNTGHNAIDEFPIHINHSTNETENVKLSEHLVIKKGIPGKCEDENTVIFYLIHTKLDYPIAFIYLQPSIRCENNRDYKAIKLVGIEVSNSFQKKGIGVALINFSIKNFNDKFERVLVSPDKSIDKNDKENLIKYYKRYSVSINGDYQAFIIQ